MLKSNKNLTIITSAYGDAYAPLLLVTLESLVKVYPHNIIKVYWQDIEASKIGFMQKAYPSCSFIKTCADITGSPDQKISSKVRIWTQAVAEAEEGPLCLMDSDMLALQDFSSFLDTDADIVFTCKPEKFPLNTGILLCNNSAKARAFMELWLEQTLSIIHNAEQLDKATSIAHPYGGADQMSFYQMLDYHRDKSEYLVETSAGVVKARAVPCAVLNETNSVSIREDHCVIHYKGAWRYILFTGEGFTKHRTQKDSFEMHCLFLQTYMRAIQKLNPYCGGSARGKFFLPIPSYINSKNWTQRFGIYPFVAMSFFAKRVVRKLKKICFQ